MDDKSLLAMRHWDLPRLLLAGAAVFALAAAGFFVAVWLQLHGPVARTEPPELKIITPEEKTRIVNSLNTTDASSTIKTSTSDGVRPPNMVQPPSTQADPHDADAAEKLKILNALNAH